MPSPVFLPSPVSYEGASRVMETSEVSISRHYQNSDAQSLEEKCSWTFIAWFFRRSLDRTLKRDKASAN